jgi:hypothetical protein
VFAKILSFVVKNVIKHKKHMYIVLFIFIYRFSSDGCSTPFKDLSQPPRHGGLQFLEVGKWSLWLIFSKLQDSLNSSQANLQIFPNTMIIAFHSSVVALLT